MEQRQNFWWIPTTYAGHHVWVGRHHRYGLAVHDPEAHNGTDADTASKLFILKSGSIKRLQRPTEQNLSSTKWLPLHYTEAEHAADEYTDWRADQERRQKIARQRTLLIRQQRKRGAQTIHRTGPKSPDSWLRLADSRNPAERRFWWIPSEAASSRWFWVGLHKDKRVGPAIHDPVIWTPRPRDTVLYLPTQRDVFRFASPPLRRHSTWDPHLSREDANWFVKHEYLPWLSRLDFVEDLAEEDDQGLEYEESDDPLEWWTEIKWWDKWSR